MRQLLIYLNFPRFSACKIIENFIKIERNVTLCTGLLVTAYRAELSVAAPGGNLDYVPPTQIFLELRERDSIVRKITKFR